MNQNNPAKHASDVNKCNQFNPTSTTHQAVLDNKSRQIQQNKNRQQDNSYNCDDKEHDYVNNRGVVREGSGLVKVRIKLKVEPDFHGYERRVAPMETLTPNASMIPKDWDSRSHSCDMEDLYAEFIDEPIGGYLRIRVEDKRWQQDGKIITLPRDAIDGIEYVSETHSGVGEPSEPAEQPVATVRRII